MNRRGYIKEYTKDTEKRLTARLKTFVRANEEGRAMFVTLTTVETDPEIAKGLLRRWTKRVSRRCRASGIYVMEFNGRGQVHYHVVLVLGGEFAHKPTADIARVFWNAWKDLGSHDRQAFDATLACLREPSWILSYMPKADLEPGVPHPERHQKRSPLSFKGRGLRAKYWGVIGRSTEPETPSEAQSVQLVDASSLVGSPRAA